MFICLFITLLLLVANNQTVIEGARYGLMLWYHDVLPLLLPFMILSNMFVLRLRNKKNPGKHAGFVFILLGLLCGYPLGAKLAADFTKESMLNRRFAAILLPMCNNVSPMFLSGYICHFVLENRYSFPFVLAMLYMPYICVSIIGLLCNRSIFRSENNTRKGRNKNTETDLSDSGSSTFGRAEPDGILLQSIIQITYVGLYIMLCSILVSLVKTIPALPANVATIFCGILEVTQGTKAVVSLPFSQATKTALILACTSFGGISAILQTKQVLQKSGLSLIHYIIMKLLCACMTGVLTYLLLI